jgi:hypothetical protein
MTTTNLTALIDQYAAIKTQLGALEVEKKRLEAALAEVPAGSYESDDYRLTISDSIRTSDSKQLAGDIKTMVDAYRAQLSRQYLQAHTIETSVRSHRVGLPTGKNLAA